MARSTTAILALAFVAVLAIQAQPPIAPPRTLPPAVTQAGYTEPPPNTVTRPGRDLSQLPPIAQQIYLSAQRGSEWLFRVNQPIGRFLPGWDPSLNQPADSDHFARQADAAATLARTARFFKNDGYTARATQAILTLLAETGPDPRDPTSRCTIAPSGVANRLATAGALLTAIHELPNPAADLQDQGEQLARFIVRQQRTDGSLICTDLTQKPSDADAAAAGQALAALARSQARRAAPWKLDTLRKAVAYYRPWWREHRNLSTAAHLCSAFAEGFLQTNDRARDIVFGEFACEIADWLCSQQLEKLDSQHPQWRGGFADAGIGQPTCVNLNCASAIIATSRVCRQLPDAERYARYRDSAVLALQFATSLQYTEANTQQFNSTYRQQFLLGGFHMSHDDGRLPLDGTPHAVTAMVAYLTGILDLQ
jgi:hypothetical protein